MAETAFTVTNVGESRKTRVENRKRVYLAFMFLRVLSFLTAITLPLPLWVRLALILLAVFLPYFAVVAANSDGKAPNREIQLPGFPSSRELMSGGTETSKNTSL